MGGLNRAEYPHDVYNSFAAQPGHPWDDDLLAIFLYYKNIHPILTTQPFRRTQARHQVVFKSAMGKMTGESVRAFHVVGQKRGLLLQKQIISWFLSTSDASDDLL